MKKFLALVLALVMTMSLVTISSSAAFSDADAIEYGEAVNVLTGLGVINGMGDGTFSPEGGVTRAQMAKMITIISLGVDEADAFQGTKTDLTDVDGHWGEAFIKYCYSQGIIAGKGNGKFDPDAPVTTAEAAKMLLVALGWNAKVQGYIGEEWKVNTLRDAFKYKVFEDINLGADKALTRDESAKIIYNTILADMVERQSGMDREDEGITDNYVVKEGKTLLGKTFNATRYEGVVTGLDYDFAKDLYIYNGNFAAIGTGANRSAMTFKAAEDYTEVVEEEVVVITQTVDGKTSTLGIYPTGDTVVELAYASTLGTKSGKLVINGTAYPVEQYTVTKELTDKDGKVTGTYETTVDSAAFTLQDEVNNDDYVSSYSLVKVTDSNENGKMDSVHFYSYRAAKVSDVNATRLITSLGDTLYYATDAIADGIEKGDYVSYTKHVNGVWVVEEIAPFEALASAVKDAKYDSVQFDSVWYNDGNNNGINDFTPGYNYRVWAFNGVVVDKEQLDGASIDNLVMVYNKGTVELTNKVAYIDAKGEKHIVSVDDSNDSDPAKNTALAYSAINAGSLYLINVTDDGVEFENPYSLPVNKTNKDYVYAGGGSVKGEDNSGADGLVEQIDSSYISGDAVIFVFDNVNKNNAKVITGTQLQNNYMTGTMVDGKAVKGIEVSANGYYTNGSQSGKLTRVTHAAVNTDAFKDLSNLNGNELYAYITADSILVRTGGTDYLQYSMWNGSENVTVMEKGNDVTDRVKGDVIRYDNVDADGYIKGVKDLNAASAAVYNDSFSKKIYVSKSTSYDVTSDTVYLYVDSRASSADAIGQTSGAVVEASEVTDKHIVVDNIAYALVNNTNDLEVVVVDITNSMSRYDNTGNVTGAKYWTDVTSAKAGDAIDFDFGDGVTFESVWGLVDSKGNKIGYDKDGNPVEVTLSGEKTYFVDNSHVFTDKDNADEDGKANTGVEAVYFVVK